MPVSFAAMPTGLPFFAVNTPSLYGGLDLGITALHWETTTNQYDYVLSYRVLGESPFLSFDHGSVLNADPDSRWNFKFKVGYIIPCTGNEIELNIINYHQDNFALVRQDENHRFILPTLSNKWPAFAQVTINSDLLQNTPIIFNVPGILGNTIPFPVEPNLVTARPTINHDAVDLDFDESLNIGCQTRIKYYGGLRFAKLDNEFDVIYNYSKPESESIQLAGVSPGSFTDIELGADLTEVVNQVTNYSGLGPHIGFDVNYHLRWCFGIVGSLSSSLLVGRMHSNLYEAFTKVGTAVVTDSNIPDLPMGYVFMDTSQTQSSLNYGAHTQIVYNIDGKLGLDYSWLQRSCTHTKWTVEAGYMISHYFNAVERLSRVNIDSPESNSAQRLSQHFNGFYLSLLVKV